MTSSKKYKNIENIHVETLLAQCIPEKTLAYKRKYYKGMQALFFHNHFMSKCYPISKPSTKEEEKFGLEILRLG